MRWQNLLFAHWPIEPEEIRPLLPPELEIDTFDGSAWIGIVPFHLTIRLNWMPFALEFPEVNVRTYTTHRGKSGVWFLSLDASSRLAVTTARLRYCLPYHTAKMELQVDRLSAAALDSVFQSTDRSVDPTGCAGNGIRPNRRMFSGRTRLARTLAHRALFVVCGQSNRRHRLRRRCAHALATPRR